MFSRFSLSNRIYASMLLLLVLVVAVVGVFSAYYFKNQNELYHKDRIMRKQNTILSAINYFFLEERESEFFPFYTAAFENKIKEFSDVNSIEIIVFDLNGELLTASDLDYVYQRSLERTPKQALERLSAGEKSVIIDRVERGRDNLSSYTILRTQANEPLAIISMSYTFDEEEVRQDFVAYSKNLSLVLLITIPIGAIIAYLLSRYIVQSIKTLESKIKHLDFNQSNEIVDWPHRDEIGTLIRAYNSKVRELKYNAEKLAKSERESAWREMAKQVAHEIKNPLTPMKLSVQHLLRSSSDNPADFQERLQRFSLTMTEQIDSLSKIASEFSDFAKMPKAQEEVLNLKSILEGCIALFSSTENTHFDLQLASEESELEIKADKLQMQRVFTNLIKNAIQAIPDDKSGVIRVKLQRVDSFVVVNISDNGTGITEEVAAKLFQPSFTTKSKGMGLGLAMVKNIVEYFHGEITFETKPNEGSTFTVSLPKYRP